MLAIGSTLTKNPTKNLNPKTLPRLALLSVHLKIFLKNLIKKKSNVRKRVLAPYKKFKPVKNLSITHGAVFEVFVNLISKFRKKKFQKKLKAKRKIFLQKSLKLHKLKQKKYKQRGRKLRALKVQKILKPWGLKQKKYKQMRLRKLRALFQIFYPAFTKALQKKKLPKTRKLLLHVSKKKNLLSLSKYLKKSKLKRKLYLRKSGRFLKKRKTRLSLKVYKFIKKIAAASRGRDGIKLFNWFRPTFGAIALAYPKKIFDLRKRITYKKKARYQVKKYIKQLIYASKTWHPGLQRTLPFKLLNYFKWANRTEVKYKFRQRRWKISSALAFYIFHNVNDMILTAKVKKVLKRKQQQKKLTAELFLKKINKKIRTKHKNTQQTESPARFRRPLFRRFLFNLRWRERTHKDLLTLGEFAVAKKSIARELFRGPNKWLLFGGKRDKKKPWKPFVLWSKAKKRRMRRRKKTRKLIYKHRERSNNYLFRFLKATTFWKKPAHAKEIIKIYNQLFAQQRCSNILKKKQSIRKALRKKYKLYIRNITTKFFSLNLPILLRSHRKHLKILQLKKKAIIFKKSPTFVEKKNEFVNFKVKKILNRRYLSNTNRFLTNIFSVNNNTSVIDDEERELRSVRILNQTLFSKKLPAATAYNENYNTIILPLKDSAEDFPIFALDLYKLYLYNITSPKILVLMNHYGLPPLQQLRNRYYRLLLVKYTKLLDTFYKKVGDHKLVKNTPQQNAAALIRDFNRTAGNRNSADLNKRGYHLITGRLSFYVHYEEFVEFYRTKQSLFKIRVTMSRIFKWLYARTDSTYLLGTKLRKLFFNNYETDKHFVYKKDLKLHFGLQPKKNLNRILKLICQLNYWLKKLIINNTHFI